MKASTRESVTKAEEDFAVALTLARPRKKPLWAPLCFHAQQCAEKYLKARLNEASISLHRTHDLEQLLNQAAAVEPLWSAFRAALKRLSDGLARMGLSDEDALAAQLPTLAPGHARWNELIDHLVVPETWVRREPAAFDALRELVQAQSAELKAMKAELKSGKPKVAAAAAAKPRAASAPVGGKAKPKAAAKPATKPATKASAKAK